MSEPKSVSTLVSFRIGDVFPADSPVAALAVSLSAAFNDMVWTATRLVGGDSVRPRKHEVPAHELVYLLRLSIAQLYEFRRSVESGLDRDGVNAFVERLPNEANRDLDVARGRGEAAWITDTIEYVRHNTTHYGGKWNWEKVETAIRVTKGDVGKFLIGTNAIAGARYLYADHIVLQSMIRHAPELAADPTIVVKPEIVQQRNAELLQSVSKSVSAAQNFVVAFMREYLAGVDQDLLTVEHSERQQTPRTRQKRKRKRR